MNQPFNIFSTLFPEEEKGQKTGETQAPGGEGDGNKEGGGVGKAIVEGGGGGAEVAGLGGGGDGKREEGDGGERNWNKEKGSKLYFGPQPTGELL